MSLAEQRGVTLIELMVGSTVGLIVLTGAIALYGNAIVGSTDNLGAAHLNQQLRASLSVISHDIRRAGYFGGEPWDEDFTANPFTDGGRDIQLGAFTGEPADSCVIYAYDLNGDAEVGVGGSCDNDPVTPLPACAAGTNGANVELFGFRLRDGAVEMRRGGGDTLSCANHDWEDITDSTVEITSLQFTVTSSSINITNPALSSCSTGDSCQFVRKVDIQIAGRLAGDHAVVQEVSDSVRIRNDRFVLNMP